MCVGILPVRMAVHHVCAVLTEARGGCLISCSRNFRQLWAVTCIYMEIEASKMAQEVKELAAQV